MRNGVVVISFFTLTALLSVSGTGSSANAPAAPKDDSNKKSGAAFEFNKKDPIYITADWMEVDQTKNTITYKGRVVTVQAEMTMRSDTLTAYYDAGMKQMKQIVAEGKVNATQGTRVATGDKAVFDDSTKTVTLTGNPVMRQGNSQVTGTKVIYFMEQDRATAEGDGKIRVQATIFPEELNQKQPDKQSDKGEPTASR
jgi:lipopolysaccharide export system protein LptA